MARNLLPASAQVLLTADTAASTVLHVLSPGQKGIMETVLPFKKQPVDGSTVCGCALIPVLVQRQNTGPR